MTDLVERLRKPSLNEDRMKDWHLWRKKHSEGYGGSGTRDAFESLLDCIDEERSEAATALEAQAKELAALREQITTAKKWQQWAEDERAKHEARAETAEQKVKELEGRRDERA